MAMIETVRTLLATPTNPVKNSIRWAVSSSYRSRRSRSCSVRFDDFSPISSMWESCGSTLVYLRIASPRLSPRAICDLTVKSSFCNGVFLTVMAQVSKASEIGTLLLSNISKVPIKVS